MHGDDSYFLITFFGYDDTQSLLQVGTFLPLLPLTKPEQWQIHKTDLQREQGR